MSTSQKISFKFHGNTIDFFLGFRTTPIHIFLHLHCNIKYDTGDWMKVSHSLRRDHAQ